MGYYWSQKCLVACFCVSIIGCDVHDKAKNATSYNKPSVTFGSVEELNSRITNGMSVTDLTNAVGPPGSQFTNQDGGLSLYFSFHDIPTEKAGNYISGISAKVLRGAVVAWAPTLSMHIGMFNEAARTSTMTSVGHRSFDVFVENDTLTNLVAEFQSKGVANAPVSGGVGDIKFEAEVFVPNQSATVLSNYSARLIISQGDLSKMAEFSQIHLGQRLLFVWNKKVIATPILTEPIATRQVMLKIRDLGAFVSAINN